MNTDERGGLPSASGMHRIALCRGSFLAERAAGPDLGDKTDAQYGTRIHDALAGKCQQHALSNEEFATFETCIAQRDSVISECGLTFDSVTRSVIKDSERLWIYDGLNRVASVQIDFAIIDSTRAFVCDYKSLAGYHSPAEENWQLRTAVAALHEWYSITEAVAAIIQPLKGQPTVVHYTEADVIAAHAEVIALAKSAMIPGQPRTPSEHACRYCRARGHCPESLAVVAKLAVGLPRDGASIALTPEQIAQFLDRAPIAEAVIEAVRAKAKRALENGETIPGWTLEPGDVRETITDVPTVFARCNELGITADVFTKAVKVTKKGLKEVVGATTGEKGKALDSRVKVIVEGCTELKPTAPSLVRVGGGR